LAGEAHELTRTQPCLWLPMISADWCRCISTYRPKDLSNASMSSFLPLTRAHPGPMWNFSPQTFICGGVSRCGSTLTETNTTSLPMRSPSSLASRDNRSCVKGQNAVQEVKKLLTTATRLWMTSLLKRTFSPDWFTTVASGTTNFIWVTGALETLSCADKDASRQRMAGTIKSLGFISVV